MARQSTSPVEFKKSVRKDRCVTMSSGRAGVVQPIGYAPLLAGDSASGRVAVDVQLKEMPRPLLNGVMARMQAWFVPKSAHPQFSGRDELMHAYTGETIKQLGAVDRDPPSFFNTIPAVSASAVGNYPLFTKLGIHVQPDQAFNTDLIDAFALIYNFRLAAHSSKLQRMKYYSEPSWADSHTTLPRAFWPSSRLSSVVPDYERALVMGQFDLDVVAGEIAYSGDIPVDMKATGLTPMVARNLSGAAATGGGQVIGQTSTLEIGKIGSGNFFESATPTPVPLVIDPMDNLFADISNMTGSFVGDSIGISLADFDKARTTQAFAKLRSAYAGNDATGFDNDDTIVALLMQGIAMPQPDDFKRPWLLDSKTVPVGFAERHATDAANLDASVTLGRASTTLSINVPRQDVSGVIMFTIEVLPERIDERMSDEWVQVTAVADLPNALRDIQRPEPVDLVLNRRIDAKHTLPGGLYGYEPMNKKWDRDFTRLGGDFYQATPGAGWDESRSNIWQTELIDPSFNSSHYLAPANFPHTVFADTFGDAFEVVCRHEISIAGLTQIGDVLVENNDDYAAVVNPQNAE